MPTTSIFLTGASSGLGRGLALHYAKAGATVFAAARRKDRLLELADEAGSAGGPGRVVPVELDVADIPALVAAVHEAERAAGGALDLVIANAGIGGDTPGKALDWTRVQQILHVDATAACVTLAAAAPAMVARDRGQLVAIASLAALGALPASAAYCASKAALSMFCDSLRIDLQQSGVAVTCVYPGFVKTELTAGNKHPMPFLLEADEAVRIIARGIERRKATVAFPLPLIAAIRAAGALPRPLYEALAGKLRPSRRPR